MWRAECHELGLAVSEESFDAIERESLLFVLLLATRVPTIRLISDPKLEAVRCCLPPT
jgi:hypothetical protein